MMTISHFYFALIIVLVGVGSMGIFIGLLEILGREAVAKPEPEVLCPDCHLLFTKSGQFRSVAHDYCPRCEARAVLQAKNEMAEMKGLKGPRA